MPEEWKWSIIMPIHKKQDKLDWSNYTGISFLCHTGIIFSSVVLQLFIQRTEEVLSEAQAGFRPGRSTVNQIFTLRQLAEKYKSLANSCLSAILTSEKPSIASGGKVYGQ